MIKTRILTGIRLYFQEVDSYLFFSIIALLAIGLVNMYGISDDGELFKKQLILVLVSLVVMIFISFFNYRYLKNYSLPVLFLYGFSLLLLGLTYYSKSIRGTNSWIIFGNLTFEPAELTKLCLIILMAKYFSQKHVHIYNFSHIVASALYFIIPAALIINQPDLGSTIILSLIWISLLLAAGISKKHLFILFLITTIVASGGWFFALKPYQKTRILSF